MKHHRLYPKKIEKTYKQDRKGSGVLRGRFISGLAAGALLGAAAGMFFVPGMDRRTRKRIVKAGRMISGFTENLWDEIKDYRR